MVGYQQSCILYGATAADTADAQVQCSTESGGYGLTFTDIEGVADVTAMSLSFHALCAVLRNRTVICMTSNIYEKLRFENSHWHAKSLKDVVDVSVGTAYFGWSEPTACAIVHPANSAASLWCWGVHDDAPLLSNSSTPWRVSGLPGDIVHVVVGDTHACVLVNNPETSRGEVYCWGDNHAAQLGQGLSVGSQGSHKPLLVKGLSNQSVSALFGGYSSTCAVTTTQQVLCWGYNYEGQLGIGPDRWEAVSVPTAMLGLCA
jgi:alpha-tubulin suppressor-like RCC1 family protein